MFSRKHIVAFFSLLLCCLALSVYAAGDQRSYKAPNSIEQIRKGKQVRLWTFTQRGEEFGRLISRVDGTERLDGRLATIVYDTLTLDFSKFSSASLMQAWGKQYLSSVGTYLGSDLNLPGQDGVEELVLRTDADPDRKTISGYFTREGRKLNRSVTISHDMFGWDIYLLDQLELWLGMQSFAVGDTLSDTLFSPQSMVTVPVFGIVDQFMNREIYQNKFDSVFVVELEQPQPLQLSFSPRGELVRVDFKGQNIRAYLDYIGTIANEKSAQTSSAKSGMSTTTVFRWFLFVLMGGVALLLLAVKGLKSSATWLALLAGIVIGLILIFIMTPLQSWLVKNLLTESTVTDSIIYLWIVPALVLALGQELFKALGIYGLVWWQNPKEFLLVSIGSAIGVGFGLCESAYQTWNFQLPSVIDWTLLGHLFMVLFHAVAGAMIGWALLRGRGMLLAIIGLNVLVNGLIHYLPGLVVAGTIEQQLVQLSTALIATVYLMVAFLIFRR